MQAALTVVRQLFRVNDPSLDRLLLDIAISWQSSSLAIAVLSANTCMLNFKYVLSSNTS